MHDDPFSPDQPTPTPPFAVQPVGTGTPSGARPPVSSAHRPKRRHAAGGARKVTGAASALAFGGLAGIIGISAHQATTTKSKTVATTATTAATESSDDGTSASTTASTTASTASAGSSAATTATPSATATTTPTTQAATSSHGS